MRLWRWLTTDHALPGWMIAFGIYWGIFTLIDSTAVIIGWLT